MRVWRRAPGFGLVELIVALTILSVGVLGLAAAAIVAYRGLTTADAMERASSAAATVLDSLVAEQTPAAGERMLHGVRVSWTVTSAYDGTSSIVATVEVAAAGVRRTVQYETVHAAATAR